MVSRQVPHEDAVGEEPTGRPAQRRRTRAAIVEATSRLVAAGRTPSVDEIAAAADVSRRTVYLYFPTLDQLLLDATVGALSTTTFEAAREQSRGSEDVVERVDGLVTALTSTADVTLPLGRQIIRLTVDSPAPIEEVGAPRRGYRRLGWIEQVVEPLRDELSAEQRGRLVAGLAVVVGWESMVVLRDLCGLDAAREEEVMRWAAQALVRAMRAE